MYASLYGKCSAYRLLEYCVENRSETCEHEARLPLSMSVDSDLVLRLGVSLTEKHSVHVVC